MKTILCIIAAALLAGCAHRSNDYRGSAPRESGAESGPRVDPELPYRQGPDLPSNERDYPRGNAVPKAE